MYFSSLYYFFLVCSLKEFLPQSYVKLKGVEKKVFKEHKKHIEVSELEAKVLYTKTARDLRTYGVAFFLVKVCAVTFFLNYLYPVHVCFENININFRKK